MKKRSLILQVVVVCIVLWVVVAIIESILPIKFPKIDRKPKADKVKVKVIGSTPKFDPNSYPIFNQMNLKGRDLSKLDLRNSENDLMHASFDTTTIWPSEDRMPQNFDSKKILEIGENPGLGIHDLHKKGITGRGVGIAIIDSPLLVDHEEYKDRVRLYEDCMEILGCIPLKLKSHMHGPAVASIAVGKKVGVAPEADLYFLARFPFDTGVKALIKVIKDRRWLQYDMAHFAKAIDRIIEINKQLPPDRKIRVISISMGWGPGMKGYEEINKAVQKAKEENIFVSCLSSDEIYRFEIYGLERLPLAQPDDCNSYQPGWIIEGRKLSPDPWFSASLLDGLFVPMQSRTIASSRGTSDYTFDRYGGESWTVPYLAGVYALAVQVDPNITPERFWALAFKTGDIGHIDNNEVRIPFGKILKPTKLITALKARQLSDKYELAIELEKLNTSKGLTETDLAFRKDINNKVGRLDLGLTTSKDIISIFGKPLFYRFRNRFLVEENLPDTYFMFYPDGFRVLIIKGHVERLEFHNPGYIFRNAIQVGSTLEEVTDTVGRPKKTIDGCTDVNAQKGILEEGVMYNNLYGNYGMDYYAPYSQGVEIHFRNNKVSSLYLTKRKP